MVAIMHTEPAPKTPEMAAYRPNISNIHHAAYKCRDAEETRHFYEDILGLEFVGALAFKPASTSQNLATPFVHIFFKMSGGDHIAFFDISDFRETGFDAHTPNWVHHIALQVPDEQSMQAMWHRLIEHGIAVRYMKDHDFCRSLYFSDPSGNYLEITCETPHAAQVWAKEKAEGREVLRRFTEEKNAARRAAAAE